MKRLNSLELNHFQKLEYFSSVMVLYQNNFQSIFLLLLLQYLLFWQFSLIVKNLCPVVWRLYWTSYVTWLCRINFLLLKNINIKIVQNFFCCWRISTLRYFALKQLFTFEELSIWFDDNHRKLKGFVEVHQQQEKKEKQRILVEHSAKCCIRNIFEHQDHQECQEYIGWIIQLEYTTKCCVCNILEHQEHQEHIGWIYQYTKCTNIPNVVCVSGDAREGFIKLQHTLKPSH